MTENRIPTRRLRCSDCGKSKPEDDTTLIRGARAGNYRTSMRSSMRRVCRVCTQERVDYVRRMQAEERNTALNDAYFQWDEAARDFGIDVSDLWVSDYDRRKRAEAAAEEARREALARQDELAGRPWFCPAHGARVQYSDRPGEVLCPHAGCDERES